MTMSFSGKQKNLHTGPPAPPRRTDENAKFEWPQEEFDDGDEVDGDTYEVPPCERHTPTVPQSEVEENVYLETSPNPTPPQRPSKPLVTAPGSGKLSVTQKPQQRAKDLRSDPKTKKAPEINRKEKPGRKTKMPPPPPVPKIAEGEDLYLDPNEKQEDSDDVYVEPAAACSPPIRMPPSPKTCPLPSPMLVCRMRSPVPKPQSNSNLACLNELKTAPSVEARRVTFPFIFPVVCPAKPVPPTPGGKPPLLSNLKKAKHSLLNPPVAAETKIVASSSGGIKAPKQSGIEGKEWFGGTCNRKTAEDLLLRLNKDGAFLIRHSSGQGIRHPYTLAVLYQHKVYNIPIRFLGEARGYSLGKEGKKNEEVFGNLDEMISHHKNNKLFLIDSQSQAKQTTYLTYPTRP